MLDRYRAILKALEGTPARLIAVSKVHPIAKIQELYHAGQRDFGENYVQELLQKDAELKSRGITDIRWHFLGHLQTNKVKSLLPVVAFIHSVDSIKLAKEVAKRAVSPVDVFVEINVENEPTKSGFLPEQIGTALGEIAALPNLRVRGLMCIPSPEGGRSGLAFRQLKALRDQHRDLLGPGELSMGMSDDYELAAREGSSWVRVGTALFGPRNP